MAQVFFPTAQDVVDAALRAISVIDPEGTATPTTTERTNALQALNFLVTSWAADGMQVWCQKQGTHALTAGTNNYTTGPGGDVAIARPLAITKAWLRSNDATPIDVPMNLIDRDTYNSLSVKTTLGNPNQLYYDPQYDRDGSNSGASAKGKLFVWPTPDTTCATNYDLYFIYTRPIGDFNALADALDFPPYYFNAVKWNLAYQLSFDYGLPIEDKSRLEKLAIDSKNLAMGFDVDPDSIFFMPEKR